MLSVHDRFPGPRGLPFLGSALEFRRDPLALLSRVAARHPIAELKLGPERVLLVNDRTTVRHILKDGAHLYGKSNRMYEAMATLFGRATSVVDGERWKQGFALIQPSFTREASAASVPLMRDAAENLASAWSSAPALADRAEDVSGMTLSLIVRQMFGTDLGGEEKPIGQAFRWLVDFIADRVTSVVQWPLEWKLPAHQEYRRTLRRLDTAIYGILRGPLSGGMLSEWIRRVRAGEVPGFGEKELRDEVIGIFVAAHGSTAVFLSWIVHHFGTHPELQERARREVRRVFPGDVEYDGLESLKYLSQFIHESMRLTPPGWVFSRTPLDQTKPMILVSPYLMHHNPAVWPDPERFDPERFAPENAEWIRIVTNECGYIPFAAGKRACTGKHMAMTEALVILSTLLKRCRWRVPPGREAVPEGRFTLNLGGGLNLETEGFC